MPVCLKIQKRWCAYFSLFKTRKLVHVSEHQILWCLFGVYYGKAPDRGEGIRETKEKSSKCTGDNYLRVSCVLTMV